MRDLALSENVTRFTPSTDPARADYACPAYIEMAPRWELVDDVRAGPMRLRAKKEAYLPKFEAETPEDWAARVLMTFADDHYDRTIVDHTGLIFAQPLKLGDDVPAQLKLLAEDIDGEGNHLDVFAQSVMDSALHLGHAAIVTDYPVTDAVKTLEDARNAQIRPYATLYKATDVLAWRTAVVGGVVVIVQLMLREQCEEAAGDFGVKTAERFREIRQEVFSDPVTQRVTGLGKITWRLFRRPPEQGGAPVLSDPGGEIVGPKRIPVRVVYGGQKLGVLKSKPHLWGVALKSVEEAQVQSDYAAVMHKCNVPTPIFIGRQKPPPGQKDEVKMGQGIDIPIGGSATMLEPTGAAIGDTRTRLQDIAASMQRQGATSADASIIRMTAAEVAMIAKQRNAKLTRAGRSLQDALEGMLQDMAAFQEITEGGGSVIVNQDFVGQQIDPMYLQVLLAAYEKDAFPLEALIYALQHGKLPDDFSAEDEALKLLADRAAAAASQPPDPNIPVPAGKPGPVSIEYDAGGRPSRLVPQGA